MVIKNKQFSKKRKGVKISSRPKKKSNKKSIFQKMQNEEDRIDGIIITEGERLELNLINKIKSFFHLHVDNYSSSHGRLMEGTLFFLNFLAILLFIFETYNPTGQIKTALVIGEIILVGIFIFEYGVRMWVSENRFKHFFSIYSIIDLISIIPVMVHFVNLSFFRIFRILRLFRMLRILRFQRAFKEENTLFGKLSTSQLIIIRIILTIFTIIFVSSGLIWAVENKINPGQFGTIWDAMYFSVVTISTVGYGDITPLSNWGKVITIFMILSGIALIPWQLGQLIKAFFLANIKRKTSCESCGLEDHDKDAIYCKHCSEILKHN